MRHYLVVTYLGLMLAGCSTTYDVPRNPHTDGFLDAQEGIEGRTVLVSLMDSTVLELTSAALLTDTITGFNQTSGIETAYPLREVAAIRAYDAWRGAGRGFLQGAIIFGSVGLLGGVAAMEPGKFLAPQDAGDVATLAAVGAAYGGLLGGVLGALTFSPYDYRFQPLEGGIRKRQAPAVPAVRLSQSITLRLTSFQDETPDQVCIMWNRKRLWLPKSEVRIEREGEHILLTVPEKLLEKD